MPEARDRRVSSLDVTATLYPRRTSFSVLADPLPSGSAPFPFTGTATDSGIFRHSIGGGRARPFHAPENTPPRANRRGRGRVSSRSGLPSWYPRTPLRDITAILRAIERRRRSRLGNEDQGSQIGTPLIHAAADPSSSSASVSRNASEIEISPKSVIKIRTPFGSKIPKIVLDISTLSEEGDSEFLTPQKKLLNSIDTVEMAVREEIMKFKKTPTAKKAEREQRVRTLMSMR